MEFEPVIGLEIHVQLDTKSKMFCPSSALTGQAPNTNIGPTCLGLPGALPVLNQKVPEFAVKLGLATNCSINLNSEFSRKHYFYPDSPRGYQISQYDKPICEHGWVEIYVNGKIKKIGITRIHMEDDAGKLVHDDSGGSNSYVDLNRAGVSLLEIVSEPDITSPEEAKAYFEKIHSIATYLKVSKGNMEHGNLRCDANVSIKPVGQEKLGTRAEVKNINSFKFLQQAVIYEIERQKEEILSGNQIVQETRLFNAAKKITFSMRKKEDAQDYRYFPDPDLPIAKLTQNFVDNIANNLPELPDAKIKRYMDSYNFSYDDASSIASDFDLSLYFEALIDLKTDPKLAWNWLMVDISRILNETKATINEFTLKPKAISELIELLQNKTISSKIAKDVFEQMLNTGKKAAVIVKEQGLTQNSNSDELKSIIDEVLSKSAAQIEQYKSGKTKVFGFFVGQVMRATKGQANPDMVTKIITEKLK